MQEQVVVPKQAYVDLLKRSADRRFALIAAKEKLAHYRAASNGEYQGGVEYTTLIKVIDEAIG